MVVSLLAFWKVQFGKGNTEMFLFNLWSSNLLNFKINISCTCIKPIVQEIYIFFISFPYVQRVGNIMKNCINIYYWLFKDCISNTVIHLWICVFFDFSESVTKSMFRPYCLDLKFDWVVLKVYIARHVTNLINRLKTIILSKIKSKLALVSLFFQLMV